ncbi:hypothetical protein [Desulfoluna spongiiphila]|nr:hypothetical protein [Desulfoluna spongiiphila]
MMVAAFMENESQNQKYAAYCLNNKIGLREVPADVKTINLRDGDGR